MKKLLTYRANAEAILGMRNTESKKSMSSGEPPML